METRRLSEETSLKNKQLEDLRNEGDSYRHEVRLSVSGLPDRKSHDLENNDRENIKDSLRWMI